MCIRQLVSEYSAEYKKLLCARELLLRYENTGNHYHMFSFCSENFAYCVLCE